MQEYERSFDKEQFLCDKQRQYSVINEVYISFFFFVSLNVFLICS